MSYRKHTVFLSGSKLHYDSYYRGGKIDSSKLTTSEAELILEKIEISDIERFIRKKKLEIINKDR